MARGDEPAEYEPGHIPGIGIQINNQFGSLQLDATEERNISRSIA